jgi:hypothetical protein
MFSGLQQSSLDSSLVVSRPSAPSLQLRSVVKDSHNCFARKMLHTGKWQLEENHYLSPKLSNMLCHPDDECCEPIDRCTLPAHRNSDARRRNHARSNVRTLKVPEGPVVPSVLAEGKIHLVPRTRRRRNFGTLIVLLPKHHKVLQRSEQNWRQLYISRQGNAILGSHILNAETTPHNQWRLVAMWAGRVGW